MSEKDLYELQQDYDGNYELFCLYGEPGEMGNPPAGGLAEEPFTGYECQDADGNWIVAHSVRPEYAIEVQQ